MKSALLTIVFLAAASQATAFVLVPHNPARVVLDTIPKNICIKGMVYDEAEDACVHSLPGSMHDDEAFVGPSE